MTARAEVLGQPSDIAVFRALQLGDLLCAIPALRGLRRAFPLSRITLIGLPWARAIAERFHTYFDAFMPFPGFPGFPEQRCNVSALPAFFERAQSRRFDLALQLHGSGGLSNPIVAMLGARLAAGYFRPGEFCPDAERFLPWRPEDHEIHRYLALLRALGIPADDPALEFPITEEDRADLRRATVGLGLDDGNYVVVHPGSQLPSRRWHPERFAAVADELAHSGYRVVLTGVEGERHLAQRVARAMRARSIDLTGKTKLGAAAALIDGAALLVSNDTGVAHIAGALGTPSVRVSCGGDDRRWAPLDGSLHRVLRHAVDCRPCSHEVCPFGHPCADGVLAESAIDAAHALLGHARRPPMVAAGDPR
jgi:ADP-heptose:LPS heptosyltransferase